MKLKARIAALSALVIALVGVGAAPAHAAISITIDTRFTGDGYYLQAGEFLGGVINNWEPDKQINFCIDGVYQDTYTLTNEEFAFNTVFNSYVESIGPGTYNYSLHVLNAGAGTVCSGGVTKTGSFTIAFPDISVEGPVGGSALDPAPLRVVVRGYIPNLKFRITLFNSGGAQFYTHDFAVPYLSGSPNYVGGPYVYDFATTWLGVSNYSYEAILVTGTPESPPYYESGKFTISGSGLPQRLSGDDRYETAAAIAGAWDGYFDKRDTEKEIYTVSDTSSSVAFVATGENFPDALSAGAAATYLGAPLLLVGKDTLPASIKTRLNALKPDIIYVLGSSSVVSSGVITKLKAISGSPTVKRLAGSDRYATMREIVKKAFGVDGDGDGAESVQLDTIVIATGQNFPDALSAGPAVASDGGTVILVDGTKSKIPDETMRLIADLDPDTIVIAGSTSAIKSGIQIQLNAAYGADSVTRLAGADRYETSLLINDYFFGDAQAVFFAVGTKFPDALAGSALAGALRSPLIVTQKSCMLPAVKTFLNTQVTPNYATLLGGPSVISDSVYAFATC